MQVIFLNGPPHCGKDHAAKWMVAEYQAAHTKFAKPLREMVCLILGIRDDEIEMLKNSPINDDGVTVRDLMITLSETFIKPILGQDWFGRRAAEEIASLESPLVVVSDCGFAHEVLACMKTLGNNEYHLWRIKRPGHSYKNDSRGWVRGVEGAHELEIGNAIDTDQFEDALDAAMDFVKSAR